MVSSCRYYKCACEYNMVSSCRDISSVSEYNVVFPVDMLEVCL